MGDSVNIVDCDGHIIESIPEMVEYMDPRIRHIALKPSRNRQGVFAQLDSIHYPRNLSLSEEERKPIRGRVNASDHRMGSAEDWVAFLDKSSIEQTVMFPSEGLSVGFFQQADYAALVCRAYNDYVSERYRKVDKRLHPVGLIAMQDVKSAVAEIRRAVLELGITAMMLPSRGLPLHLGHDYYWPVYEEAANLGCALGVHGGSSVGMGADTFTDPTAARALRHPVPLALEMVSLIHHGVFDRYRDLRVGFFEGGCAWTVLLLDRQDRDESVYIVRHGKRRTIEEYLSSGQVLVGCEGNDEVLSYIKQKAGIDAFAFATDYPHEVDLVAAKNMIQGALERPDLTLSEKRAVMGENAKKFFRLQ